LRMMRLYEAMEMQQGIQELDKNTWQKLREKAQKKVLNEAPKEILGKYRDPEAKTTVRRYIQMVVENELPSYPLQARQGITERLVNEIQGYGPLEHFLDDPKVTEVIVERYDKVMIEEDGELRDVDVVFDSEEHLRLVIERIIAPLGRRLDWSSPTVDARLPDGSRVCAVIPPIAPDGTTVAIRKFRPNVSMKDLVEWEMLPESVRKGLEACVNGRLNIIVSGGTGSGKTTFLNALSEYISPKLSVITIENPVEMQLRHPNVRRWEARPANIEGTGEIDMMSLVITALRSRPDIIIVGEVRGREAYAMMQAMNTGHLGSMTTLHANNTAQAMERLVAMVASAQELPKELVPGYISETVDLVIHLMRMADSKRRLVEISEVMGEKGGKILTNPLIEYRVDSFKDGKITGHWKTVSSFTRIEILKDRGVIFPGFVDGGDN
jgi:pilus assembly protein CpaF